MKYMLDTNICVYIMKHVPNVMERFFSKRTDGVAISSIVLAELEYGVCNSDFYERSRKKLMSFLQLVEILHFDDEAAVHYGQIRADLRRKGKTIGIPDAMIAAHARSKGLIAVTNNTREFERVAGLELENWVD